MTEVELHADLGTTGANLIREAAAVMADAHALASAVANTQMIPKHFQGKPDECAAAMLYGASLGLDPMQSVRQIYVVHGQAALYARAMSALVLGAGHEVWTVESTDESVTVAGRRRGAQAVESSTWTFDRANKAGYTNNAKYKTDPQAMLYSKALSEVCRKIAPDVLSGVYAVEELQMERWDSAPQQRHGSQLKARLAELAPAEPLAESSVTSAPSLFDAAISHFAGFKVTREQLVDKFGGREPEAWTDADLQALRDISDAINAGHTTIAAEFPSKEITAAELIGGEGA